jgi:CRISPR-associated exonuclease Cas4
MLFLLAGLVVALALFLLWQAGRRQEEAGLPAGRVIYADQEQWGRAEKPFYDDALKLTGKPDYLVQLHDTTIPVEVKSSSAPPVPHEGHILQLAAYCLLVERSTGKRPPYGILHYQNRDFSIDYTVGLETNLLATLTEMRRLERQAEVERSHESAARCARCGYRDLCDDRL